MSTSPKPRLIEAHMVADSSERPSRRRRTAAAGDDVPADDRDEVDEPTARPSSGRGVGIATSRDAAGVPVHRGWAPVAAHHRWLEPFVLMALAQGEAHGYGIIGALTEVGISESSVDVGQVYRTLRDLEQAGQVSSTWNTGTGAPRRDYTITAAGARALDEWAAVMKERQRLIAEFDATYLAWSAEHPRDDDEADRPA